MKGQFRFLGSFDQWYLLEIRHLPATASDTPLVFLQIFNGYTDILKYSVRLPSSQ